MNCVKAPDRCDKIKMIKNTVTAVFWNLEAGHVMGLTVNLPSKLNGSGQAEKWDGFITPGTVKLLNYIWGVQYLVDEFSTS